MENSLHLHSVLDKHHHLIRTSSSKHTLCYCYCKHFTPFFTQHSTSLVKKREAVSVKLVIRRRGGRDKQRFLPCNSDGYILFAVHRFLLHPLLYRWSDPTGQLLQSDLNPLAFKTNWPCHRITQHSSGWSDPLFNVNFTVNHSSLFSLQLLSNFAAATLRIHTSCPSETLPLALHHACNCACVCFCYDLFTHAYI